MAATGAVYPPFCDCGGSWQAAAPEIYLRGIPDDLLYRTPIWPDPRDPELLWKREDYSRTGSFKDRGATVLVAWARARGARALVVDSSGSAALAAASAAARWGLPLRVHVPSAVAPEKLEVLALFGAEVVARGNRDAASARALADAAKRFYASHVHHPAFTVGTGSAGSEVLDELGAEAPPIWVLPVGNGSLLLGLARELEAAGRDDVRLIAVQASACAGLLRPGIPGKTAAAGIAIPNPVRREEILETIDRFHGEVLEATEEELASAKADLWLRGAAVETACAAALVGVQKLRAGKARGPILGFLTGSGHRGERLPGETSAPDRC